MGVHQWVSLLRPRRGDLNGFIQLFFDNVATLLSLIFFLQIVLRGFSNGTLAAAADGEFAAELAPLSAFIDGIIYERAIPGLAITMVFGNVYYTWMGARLGLREGRGDVTALPYGVNTPGAFAFLFGIIGPAASIAGASCDGAQLTSSEQAIAFRQCWEQAAEQGWAAGVVSNFIAGIISVGLGLLGTYVLKVTPGVALLTALAGIGFSFLGIVQVGTSFAEPIAGLLPLFLTITIYFGEVSLGWFPKSLLVALIGIALGWMDGVATPEAVEAATDNVRWWGVTAGTSALGDWSTVGDYIGTTFPVALAAAAGTLMNVLSAERAGDKFGVREAMVSDGVGTMIGAVFGTPFGTSVYIGHPAYKKMGAGVAYSLINCTLFLFFGLSGVFALISALVPSQAIAPLIFFVGVMICQEAIASAPVRQVPSVFLGLMPSILDWAVSGGLNLSSIGGPNFFGMLSMSKGALLLALVITSISFYAIERNFAAAAAWSTIGAGLSAFGLLHQGDAKVQDWTSPQSLYCQVPLPSSGVCAVGFQPCSSNGATMCAPLSTTKWRYMTGYLMIAAMFLLLWAAQHKGWVDPVVSEAVHESESAELAKSHTVQLARAAESSPDMSGKGLPADDHTSKKSGDAKLEEEDKDSESIAQDVSLHSQTVAERQDSSEIRPIQVV